MKKDVDVLVIGGGVIGICSAHYLAAAGRRVTVVERGEIGSGCSYGNSGLIVPSHSVPLSAPGTVLKGLKWMFDPESPFYIKPRLDLDLLSWLWKFRGCCNRGHLNRAAPLIRDLSLESLRLYHELAALGDLHFGFEQRGVLALYNSRKGLAEGVEEAHFLQGIGIEVEVLSAEQVRAKEPNVHITALGGVYYAQDAHLTPARFVSRACPPQPRPGSGHQDADRGSGLRDGTGQGAQGTDHEGGLRARGGGAGRRFLVSIHGP